MHTLRTYICYEFVHFSWSSLVLMSVWPISTLHFHTFTCQLNSYTGGRCVPSLNVFVLHSTSCFSPSLLQDGVFIQGLYLEGSGWDKKASCLVEAEPMQLVCPMPSIHFKPVESRKRVAKSEYTVLHTSLYYRVFSFEFSCQLYVNTFSKCWCSGVCVQICTPVPATTTPWGPVVVVGRHSW